MCVQKSPIFCVLCIDLNRNCWILILIDVFLRPFHMATLVSHSPLMAYSASFVRCRLRFVAWRSLDGFCSRIPLYVIAWDRVDSFAPWRLNSLGISRSRAFGVGLFAPSLASRSQASFPASPSWPFTH